MKHVPMKEAGRTLRKLCDAAQEGEVTITYHGAPVAKIVPAGGAAAVSAAIDPGDAIREALGSLPCAWGWDREAWCSNDEIELSGCCAPCQIRRALSLRKGTSER
jgi:prevent-host-death family protein